MKGSLKVLEIKGLRLEGLKLHPQSSPQRPPAHPFRASVIISETARRVSTGRDVYVSLFSTLAKRRETLAGTQSLDLGLRLKTIKRQNKIPPSFSTMTNLPPSRSFGKGISANNSANHVQAWLRATTQSSAELQGTWVWRHQLKCRTRIEITTIDIPVCLFIHPSFPISFPKGKPRSFILQYRDANALG